LGQMKQGNATPAASSFRYRAAVWPFGHCDGGR